MKNISPHITYAEATKSQTAIRFKIDNTPSEIELENMRRVANSIFEPLRAVKGVPIFVSSFYRSRQLNKKIGGSINSGHVRGECMDLDADVFNVWTNAEIFHWIKDNCEFDQLIWEFGTDENPEWVHVGLKASGNRNQILVSYVDEYGDVNYKNHEESI